MPGNEAEAAELLDGYLARQRARPLSGTKLAAEFAETAHDDQ
jgi:hypothetical protein